MSGTPSLSPRLLVAAVSTFVAVLDAERQLRVGPWAELVARRTGVPPNERWDAALVQHCGYWSHFDHETGRSAWPIAAAVSAEDFAAFGRARGLLREAPEAGDILLQYNPGRGKFVRAGVVVRVVGSGWWTPKRPYAEVLSIEGDTARDGGLGGTDVFRVARRACASTGDRFLRWSDAACPSAQLSVVGKAA